MGEWGHGPCSLTGLGVHTGSFAWLHLATRLSPPTWVSFFAPQGLVSHLNLDVQVAGFMPCTGAGDLALGRSSVFATSAS